MARRARSGEQEAGSKKRGAKAVLFRHLAAGFTLPAAGFLLLAPAIPRRLPEKTGIGSASYAESYRKPARA